MKNQPFKFITILPALLLVLALSLAGCSDDPRIPDEPDTDNFDGPQCVITLGSETADLTSGDISLLILAPDGSTITRRASHIRSGANSTIRMQSGLRNGEYRLLAAVTDNSDSELSAEFPTVEYGLGSRIGVSDAGIEILDSFNPTVGYAGEGTKESPYIISSSSHLFNLMMTVNDYDSYRDIPAGTYFKQVRDIDMKQSSRSCDMEYGWLPIGADTNTPFRGVYLGDGHKITNLYIKRPSSPGIGLFGYILDATIDGLTMRSCTVEGQFAVGTLAGASITSSQSRGVSSITNCTAEDCTVSGNTTSAALGGILGAADMYTRTLLANCTVKGGSVSGAMNAGGLMGGSGIYSSTSISGCTNSASVTTAYSGAGGIVGTADTLQVAACTNTAAIKGATAAGNSPDGIPGIGTGGLVGGAGMAWISSSTNSGPVAGLDGVGGIIGSTRIRGSESESFVYNQAYLRYCFNSGSVTGSDFVGGAIGEAQAGTYAVGNTADVSGKRYVGGICGNSSIAVIHNAVNSGAVRGEKYIAGIVGKTTWASLALDQNNGPVTASTGHAGGIAALCGNNTVIHYCSNRNSISAPSDKPVGGIVGEVGDPRKWTGMNIAECVVGSLEVVMAFVGPALAVTEAAVDIAHGVEVVLKISEFTAEALLQATDYTLVGFSLKEIISPEVEESLSASITAQAKEADSSIAHEIQYLRANNDGADVFSDNDFTLLSACTNNTNTIVDWYEAEGNDEHFNERINEAREERAESLEKVAKAKEIFHTVVAGVAVVVSTVALVGGTIASGGTATAFLAAGSVAAIAGGLNAITKSCTEFEHNAAIISQCSNMGMLISPGNYYCGTIVGELQDGAEIRDCLNAATFNGKSTNGVLATQPFVGKTHSQNVITHNVSSVGNYDPNNLNIPAAYSIIGAQNLTSPVNVFSVSFLTAKEMRNLDNYERLDFDLGTDGLWHQHTGDLFPLPRVSEMQR